MNRRPARGAVPAWCAAAWILTAGVTATAQSLPALTAPVNDFAHVIDAESASRLDRRIRALQAATGDVVVVATVQTFAPYGSIEEYAVRLFEPARIGQNNKDNGVLIVLALSERRVRIEVGYGLEQFITDGFSGETIREVMLPEFRRDAYGAGLVNGATRIIARIAEARGVTLQDVAPSVIPDRTSSSRIPVGAMVFLVILILAMILRGRRGGPRGFTRHGRGPWSGWSSGVGGFGGGGFGGGGFGSGGFGGGGGGGGGFGGFGGGRSGGGGASGGW